jgi:hypothetical protein
MCVWGKLSVAMFVSILLFVNLEKGVLNRFHCLKNLRYHQYDTVSSFLYGSLSLHFMGCYVCPYEAGSEVAASLQFLPSLSPISCFLTQDFIALPF